MELKEKFEQLKKENKKAFNVYFPFGFPCLDSSVDIFFALQGAGVDIIELGFPFSDPLADGPIIQKASTVALRQKNVTLDAFFNTIKKIKKDIKIPVVAMSYYNPVFRYGIDKFFLRASENKITATILVDLPLEEGGQYLACAKKFGVNPIFFITPATSSQRTQKIAKAARGFIYYISVTGTTGPKSLNFEKISSHIKAIKKITTTPVCVGFGIHNKSQVKKINSFSDGVIIGSEIIKFIDRNHKRRNFLKSLEKKVRSLGAQKS